MQRQSRQDRLYPSMPKTAVVGGGTSLGGDVYNAIPRFYDPLEYWDISGLPWNIADEGHRHKLHKWMRLYYATHYLVPILVDIFTRFPLVGMEVESKDPEITRIYKDLFLDQLNYEDFLVGLGREFWLCGEAYPLGSFDEDLGIWEHEELINPEDVVIDNLQQLKIVPPDYLRRIAQTQSPAREWFFLKQNYEDLIPYLLKGEHIPMSPVMLRQVANKLFDILCLVDDELFVGFKVSPASATYCKIDLCIVVRHRFFRIAVALSACCAWRQVIKEEIRVDTVIIRDQLGISHRI